MWDITDILLTIFIFGLVTATALISASYELRNKQEPNFIKSLTSNGWIVLILSAFTLMLTQVQKSYTAYQGRIEVKQSSDTLRADYAKSVGQITQEYDSKTKGLKATYDSSFIELKSKYDTSTQDIVKALAEYDLGYNEKTKRIEKLIAETRSPEPDFSFCMDNPLIVDSSTGLSIAFNICSYKATANNIDVVCYIVHHLKTGDYVYGGSNRPIPSNSELGMNRKYSSSRVTFKRADLSQIKHLFVLIKGSFTNKDGTKKFSMNEMVGYDFEMRKSAWPSPYFEEKVRSTLNPIIGK